MGTLSGNRDLAAAEMVVMAVIPFTSDPRHPPCAGEGPGGLSPVRSG